MRWHPAAGRAITRAVVLSLLSCTCWCTATPVLAQTVPVPVVTLASELESVEGEGLGSMWLDASGKAAPEQVLQGRAGLFKSMPRTDVRAPGANAALWLHFRLLRPAGQRQNWLLELPLPGLDIATVFQQDASGKWHEQSAGDQLAVRTWPQPGRYPVFRLELPEGQARDVYLRLRHMTQSTLPLRFTAETVHEHQVQIEYLGLGAVLGALLLLIAACISQSWLYRDSVYGWYALYAAVMSLAVSSYTGVAAHLLWSNSQYWNETAKSTLALLAGAAALLFLRKLTGLAARHRRLDSGVLGLGVAGIFFAALLHVVDKTSGLTVMAMYVVFATFLSVWIAWLSWRRGDANGPWIFFALAPVALATLMAIMRLLGWVPAVYGTLYAVVAALALELPLLLVALAIRSREQHGAHIREMALSTQDALTGLLAPHLFNDRLLQVVKAQHRGRADVAVVFIELVNHAQIREVHGPAVAEQSLLRSVMKLRRLLRDIDTPSRVGDARFAVILEGVSSRAVVTDRMARLIAAGLMPLPGLKPEVTLQFHAAAVLLAERAMGASELTIALEELLGGMSPRTRRPIRFLNAEPGTETPISSLGG